MLVFILSTVLLFLLINYYVSDRDYFNPCVIFCATQALSLFFCLIFGGDYGVSFHVDTWLVITLGLIAFSVVNFLSLLPYNNLRSKGSRIPAPLSYIKVDTKLIVITTVFQLVVFVLSLGYVVSVARAYYGGGRNIFEYIGLYRSFNIYHADKLSTLNVSRNILVRFGKVMTSIMCYPLMAIEINNIIVRRKVDKLLCCPILINIVFSFITGTRSEAFRIITAMLYFYIILNRKYKGRVTKLNFKSLFCGTLSIVIIAFGFLAVRQFIGRSQAVLSKWYYSIMPYFGGPFMNLDNALTSDLPSTVVWGQYTFTDIINEFFLGILHIPRYSMADINIFNRFNGINTGNVYTTYYTIMVDFGFWGIIPLVSIIAIFYCWTYNRNLNLYNNNTPLGTRFFFSGYMFNSLVMLIFSNRFYENIFSMFTVVLIVGMWLYWKVITKNLKSLLTNG